jgi:hypothetical protein
MKKRREDRHTILPSLCLMLLLYLSLDAQLPQWPSGESTMTLLARKVVEVARCKFASAML